MATELKSSFLARGAEAEIYLIDFFGLKAILKRRISKAYRNPVYDELFIKNRTRIEARILTELYSNEVNVPALFLVDEEHGVLIMEYIEGANLASVFDKLDIDRLHKIAVEIGALAGRMHSLGIYHGDFTLANMMIRNGRVVLIDFGLSGYSDDIEEYAIDLHLLRRSIRVARPEITDRFMNMLLDSYSRTYRGDANEVVKRMHEISARGRYVDREIRKAIMRERYIG